MNLPPAPDLVSTLQVVIGPSILISAAGLVQLTLVNRLNHIQDRIRLLADRADLRVEDQTDKTRKSRQLAILWRRAHWIRSATLLVTLSALCSACLILVLFLVTALHLDAVVLIGICFMAAILSLVLSLALLMADIQQSLSALRLELRVPD